MAGAIHSDSILTKVGSNLTFLKGWATDNEGTFCKTMEILADENPAKFAELYLRVQTQIAEPKENKTNINIHVDNDLAKLQALAGTVDSRRIEAPETKTEYADFEELQNRATL